MKKFRLRAPSPALLISMIALFVALGGTTYAAATSLAPNSVGTAQLKSLAVTQAKIANGAVTATKINATGLTVPNANTVGGVAAAQLQRTVSGSCSVGSAISAVAANGTVTCQTTPAADGPAVEMGNVLLSGSSCELAPPSGGSTSAGCSLGAAQAVWSPVPVDRVLANFRAEIPAAVAHDIGVWIAAGNNSGYTPWIGCYITAGNTSCTAASPSATVSASTTNLILLAETTSAMHLAFSYEMGPAGVSFGARRHGTPHRFDG